jgi:hypothetical protein
MKKRLGLSQGRLLSIFLPNDMQKKIGLQFNETNLKKIHFNVNRVSRIGL